MDGFIELWDVSADPESPPVTVRQCKGRFEVMALGDVADWQVQALILALQEWIDQRGD